MPVSVVCESPADISSAIRNSLPSNLTLNGTTTDASAHDDDLQNQLIASAKRAFLSKIDYEESVNRNVNNDTLKSKYIVLKTVPNVTNANGAAVNSTAATNAVSGSATAMSPNQTNGKFNGTAIVNGGSLKDKLNLSGCSTGKLTYSSSSFFLYNFWFLLCVVYCVVWPGAIASVRE